MTEHASAENAPAENAPAQNAPAQNGAATPSRDRIVYESRDWSEVVARERAAQREAAPAPSRADRIRALALEQNLTIRLAEPDDEPALRRLEALDSRSVPLGRTLGEILLAEVGDELWAAVTLDGRTAMGDPFRPTGELIALLNQRLRQFERAERWPHGRPSVLRRMRPRRPSAHVRG